MPEMPDGGMPEGDMSAMIPGGFTPPAMTGAETTNETPAPDTSVQTDPPEAATNTDSAPSAGKTTNETRSTRGNRTNFTGETASPNPPSANAGVKTAASSETLLIASICVLLASIAIALFVKHE